VARVLVLTGDLLFGSNLQGALAAAGHRVELVPGRERLAQALAEDAPGLVIVDLTDEALAGAEIFASLSAQLAETPSLGFYSHVDPAAREAGQAAGIGLVVPRSRMAREAGALVDGILAG
jgi:DNA-binding NarL/FixJ family response regulator